MSSRKICTKCKIEKDLSEFNNCKENKDGKEFSCKVCRNTHLRNVRKTKRGVLCKIYSSQCRSSKQRGMKPPEYTLEEFIEYGYSKDIYHKLYDNWVISGYLRKLVPSFDRLDNAKGYSFGNIRICTWEENYRKEHINLKNGLIPDRIKGVTVYNISTDKLTSYFSISETSRQLSIHTSSITSTCKEHSVKCKGYIFMYTDTYNKLGQPYLDYRKRISKEPSWTNIEIQVLDKTTSQTRYYYNYNEVMKDINIHKSMLSKIDDKGRDYKGKFIKVLRHNKGDFR